MVTEGDAASSSTNLSSKTPSLEIISDTNIQMKEMVGVGGFGTVHRAEHKQWGIVAVKKLDTNFIAPRAKQRLVDEAKKLHGLSHPNIIQMLGLVMGDKLYALVLEFLPRGSLDNFIGEYPVSWAMKLEFIDGIVLGMNYLHTRKSAIIHKDLKAPNILVGRDCTVKVCDFGLSEWRAYSENYTMRANKVLGTVTHVPPESWANLALRPTTSYDMYSFAILVWEVCAEEIPFHGVSNTLIKEGVKDGQRPDLDVVKAAGAPDVLIRIMIDCWSQDYHYRPTFDIVKEALDADQTRVGVDMLKERLDLMEKTTAVGAEVVVDEPNGVMAGLGSDLRDLNLPTALHTDHPAGLVGLPRMHHMDRPLQREVQPAYPNSTDSAFREPLPVNQQANRLDEEASSGVKQVFARYIEPVYPASTEFPARTHLSENFSGNPVQSFEEPCEPEIDGSGSEPPTPESYPPRDGPHLRQKPGTNLQINQSPSATAQVHSVSSQPPNYQQILRAKSSNQPVPSRDSSASHGSNVSRGSTLPRETEPDAEPESINSLSPPPERLPPTTDLFSGAATSNRTGGAVPRPAPQAGPRVGPRPGPQMTSPPPPMLPGFLKEFLPKMNMELPDFSKSIPSSYLIHQRDGMGTTVICNSDKSKSNSIQIGDHNVMNIYSGPRPSSAAASAWPRSQPRPPVPRPIPQNRITRSTKPLDLANMDVVSKHLGKYWKALGRRLGFSTGELDQINADYHVDGLQEKIHQMLVRWCTKEGKAATVGALAEKLWGIEQYSLAAALK